MMSGDASEAGAVNSTDVAKDPAWEKYTPVRNGSNIRSNDVFLQTDEQYTAMMMAARGSSAARRSKHIYQSGATVAEMVERGVSSGVCDSKGTIYTRVTFLDQLKKDLAWEANPEIRVAKDGTTERQNDLLQPRCALYRMRSDSSNLDEAGSKRGKRLRSRDWFDNPHNPGMTALYVERYLNQAFTREEIVGGKPIIGIAQTGSDLSPCNKIHVLLASRVRDGIRAAGGVPMELPVHPIQETGKRPTAALDRNLAYLGLVEVLNGYPLDGVVLTTGCD
jgi:hypothetical protein